MKEAARVSASVQFIREQTKLRPRIGVILGSGLGDFADSLPEAISISTENIPHYPRSSVEGHKGKLVFAALGGVPILTFQGRIHFYETNDLAPVLYPIYIAHYLGIELLIVTNAAGGINRTFNAGDLMIISDHINLTFARLITPQPERSGARGVYTPSLITLAEEVAAANRIATRRGVYVGLKGPSYETAAEIEMLSRLGADAVGMSTVFETSLAASLGMRVLGISCITNLATGISGSKLSHEEVTEVGKRVKETFARLLAAIITQIGVRDSEGRSVPQSS
jgi:purine-nucleoside phosphorylase